MKTRISTLLCFLLALLMLPLIQAPVSAEQPAAKEISSRQLVTDMQGFYYCDWLFDTATKYGQQIPSNSTMTLEHEEGIGSLYLHYQKTPIVEYTVTNSDTGESRTCGTNGFLHEFVDVVELFGAPAKKLTITFGENPSLITEMRVFTQGEPPKDVQRWQLAPEEGVDLLVFSAHGDDEQLFFAGLLPYYAGELGYQVQVVYSTDHMNYGPDRAHEILDGLWVTGVTNYPVMGPFPDYLTQSAEETINSLVVRGFAEDAVPQFVMEQVRRFKPLVMVSHDLEGEYGHGMHRLIAQSVKEAAENSANSSIFPESAQKYGVWDVPKTYLHLYPENQIVMDWDQPLAHFDGMTGWQVTRNLGFPAHKSQYRDFYWYIEPETAAEVPEMNPCEYGLVRTTVGADAEKNDMFENLLCRAEEKVLEEQRLKEEAEKQAQLEAEQARAEQEALEAEQAAKETEIYQRVSYPQEEIDHSRNMLILTLSSIFLVLLLISWLLFRKKNRK